MDKKIPDAGNFFIIHCLIVWLCSAHPHLDRYLYHLKRGSYSWQCHSIVILPYDHHPPQLTFTSSHLTNHRQHVTSVSVVFDSSLLRDPRVVFAGYRMPHPLENRMHVKVTHSIVVECHHYFIVVCDVLLVLSVAVAV
jgi:hypothetical protein